MVSEVPFGQECLGNVGDVMYLQLLAQPDHSLGCSSCLETSSSAAKLFVVKFPERKERSCLNHFFIFQ